MSGSQSNTRRLVTVLMSVVMVLSVVGMGGAGLAAAQEQQPTYNLEFDGNSDTPYAFGVPGPTDQTFGEFIVDTTEVGTQEVDDTAGGTIYELEDGEWTQVTDETNVAGLQAYVLTGNEDTVSAQAEIAQDDDGQFQTASLALDGGTNFVTPTAQGEVNDSLTFQITDGDATQVQNPYAEPSVSPGTETLFSSVGVADGGEEVNPFAGYFLISDSGQYTSTINTGDDQTAANDGLNLEAAPDSANFEVTNVSPQDDNVTEGEPLAVEITVENTGGVEDMQGVGLGVNTDDLQDDYGDDPTSQFESVNSTALTLDPSSQETVTLTYASAIGDAPEIDVFGGTEDDFAIEPATLDAAPGPQFESATVEDGSPSEIVVSFDENVTAPTENPALANDFFTLDPDEDLANNPTVAGDNLAVANGNIIVPLNDTVAASDNGTLTNALSYDAGSETVVAQSDARPADAFSNESVTNNVEESSSQPPTEGTLNASEIDATPDTPGAESDHSVTLEVTADSTATADDVSEITLDYSAGDFPSENGDVTSVSDNGNLDEFIINAETDNAIDLSDNSSVEVTESNNAITIDLSDVVDANTPVLEQGDTIDITLTPITNADAGTYDVNATVADASENTDTTTTTVSVGAQELDSFNASVSPSSDQPVTQGEPLEVSFSDATDSNDETFTGDNVTVSVNTSTLAGYDGGPDTVTVDFDDGGATPVVTLLDSNATESIDAQDATELTATVSGDVTTDNETTTTFDVTVTEAAGPEFQTATIEDGSPSEIVVSFDENVTGDAGDAADFFTFDPDETLTNSPSVAVGGNLTAEDGDIIVPLDGAIDASDNDTLTNALTYDDTSDTVVAQSDDTPAEPFSNESVTNNVEDDQPPTEDPANFTVADLEPTDETVNVGEEFDVSANVTNTGGDGMQTVGLALEPDGEDVANQSVELNNSEQTTVTFENVTVPNAGEYNHTVATENDSVSGNLTVEAQDTQAANFTVSINDDASDVDVVAGQQAVVNATIENVGDANGNQSVSATFNETESSESVQLDAGNNTTVEFTSTELTTDDNGDTVTVESENDTDTTTLSVREADSGDLNISAEPGVSGQENDFTYTFNASDSSDDSDTNELLLDFNDSSGIDTSDISDDDVTVTIDDVSDESVDSVQEDNAQELQVTLGSTFTLSEVDGDIVVDVANVSDASSGTFNGSFEVRDDSSVALTSGAGDYMISEQADDPTLESIDFAIDGDTSETTLAAGDEVGYTVTANFDDGSNETVTADNVTSDNTDAVTVNETAAEVTADAAGDANVTAEYEGENATVNVTVTEQDSEQANFTVSINDGPTDVTVIEEQDAVVNATIENDGDATGEQLITATLNDTEFGNESVELDAGNSTTVEFNTSSTNSSDDGETITVASEDTNATRELTVREADSGDLNISASPGEAGQDFTYTFNASDSSDDSDTNELLLDFNDSSGIDTSDISDDDVNVTIDSVSDESVDSVQEDNAQELLVTLGSTFTLEGVDGDIVVDVADVSNADNGTHDGAFEVRDDSSVALTSGEDDYTISEPAEPANFDVTVDSVNESVTEGEDIVAEYTVNNTGGESGTQNITFDVNDSEEDVNQDVQLDAGANTSDSFTYSTSSDDPSELTVNVSSANDTDSNTVTVNEPADPANFDVTVDSVNESVTEGEDIVAEYTVNNTGGESGTQNITFDVNDSEEDVNQDVQLDAGANTSDSFTYSTSSDDPSELTVNVSSANDTDSNTVTVEESAAATVDTVDANLSDSNVTFTTSSYTNVADNNVDVLVVNENGTSDGGIDEVVATASDLGEDTHDVTVNQNTTNISDNDTLRVEIFESNDPTLDDTPLDSATDTVSNSSEL